MESSRSIDDADEALMKQVSASDHFENDGTSTLGKRKAERVDDINESNSVGAEEAEEDSASGSAVDVEEQTDLFVKPVKKQKRIDANLPFDSEAAEESGDDDDDDDDDEDNDDNQYFADGFVVPDEDDGDAFDEDDGEKESAKKTKSKEWRRLQRKQNFGIDDEDRQLIEDNANLQRNRDTASEKSLSDDEIEKSTHLAREYGGADESDMDNFIDDSKELGDAHDDGIDQLKPQRVKSSMLPSRRAGVRRDEPTYDQIQDAAAIFGEGYDDFDDDVDDEDADGNIMPNSLEYEQTGASNNDKQMKKLLSRFEHSQLVARFCTERDEEIRREDKPERLQMVMPGRGAPDDGEREKQARWIAEKLASKILESEEINSIEQLSREAQLRVELPESITYVLQCLQGTTSQSWLEVPFIWTYRRDYLHPKLKREHLWMIHRYDIAWEKQYITKIRLMDEIQALYDAANERDKLQDSEENNEKEERRIQRLEQSARFDSIRSKEAIRLFPVEKYVEIATSCTEDIELRDVVRFLRLIAMYTEQDADVSPSKEASAPAQNANELVSTEFEPSPNTEQINKKVIFRRKLNHDYSKYRRVKELRNFCEKISVTAAEFGDSLLCDYKVDPPPTMPVTCEEAAADLVGISKDLRSIDQVLYAATVIIATELSMEPTVRKKAREVFLLSATVSTRPTEKGLAEINPFSEFFGIHFLHRKPLKDFFDNIRDRTLFIRIVQAERLKLITVSIDEPKMPTPEYDDNGEIAATKEVSDLQPFLAGDLRLMVKFMPSLNAEDDKYFAQRQSWDCVRIQVLSTCIEKYLLPSLQAEFRQALIRLGKESIVEEASMAFAERLKVGPYIPYDSDVGERTKMLLLSCPKRPFYAAVAAIYVGIGKKEPMCMAYVNKDGILRAHEYLPGEAIIQKKKRITQFILENRPDLIVINSSAGAASRSTLSLIEREIMREVSVQLEKENRFLRQQREEEENGGEDVIQDDDEDPYRPRIMIISDEVANIFKRSPRSKEMFPDLDPTEAAAVCLARCAQEPLAEYCAMWHSPNSQDVFGHELLYLNLHSMKNLLGGARSHLLAALEHNLVDAVCDIGVDINRAVAFDHVAPMLTFVGGLGLRKADALRKILRQKLDFIPSRDILNEKRILSQTVWNNAAGFLRITDFGGDSDVSDLVGSAEENNYPVRRRNPFDNTRIHPECYRTHDFAKKICADALDVEYQAEDYYDIVERLMKVVRKDLEKRIKKHPGWLKVWDEGRPIPGVTKCDETFRTSDGSEYPLNIELSDCLSQLLLEDFAREQENLGYGKIFLLLESIKDELRYPWLDLRKPLRQITPNEMFTIMTGQTHETLHVGMKTAGTIIEIVSERVGHDEQYLDPPRERAVVRTEAGLRGYITNYDVTDNDGPVENLRQYLTEGMHVQPVVIGIKKDRMLLDLSLRPSLCSTTETWWIKNRFNSNLMFQWLKETGREPRELYDRYFDESQALLEYDNYLNRDARHTMTLANQSSNLREEKNSGPIGKKKSTLAFSRVVQHPLFANLGFRDAEQKLIMEGKGAGEVVIRPSSKGPDYLTITWAFQDGWFKHIMVHEKGHRQGALGLGSPLIVMEDGVREIPFSDLDEIYARYIEPMNDLVAVMVKDSRFRFGEPDDVVAVMKSQHQENPRRIPYFFRFEKDRPGMFALTWLEVSEKSRTAQAKSLRIDVRPDGYWVPKNMTFSRPSEIIIWFKKWMSKQQQQVQYPPHQPEQLRGQRPNHSLANTAAPQRRTRWN